MFRKLSVKHKPDAESEKANAKKSDAKKKTSGRKKSKTNTTAATVTKHKKRRVKKKVRLDVSYNRRFTSLTELKGSVMEKEMPSIRGAYMMLSKKEPYIITAASSIRGNRPDQQDSYYVTEPTKISPFRLNRSYAVVCDGMGGLEAGDRASLTAVSMMKLAVRKLPTKQIDIPHFLSEMLDYIDYEISHFDDLSSDKGAGTTFVSVFIENRQLYWASVGDSTIFMFQDGTLKRITSRHNYKMFLDKLVENGKITREEAESDPRRNTLLSYLGMGGISYRDINSKPYFMRSGDMLLLCTDGVTDNLTPEELTEIITENYDDLYQCSREITRLAAEKNKKTLDNTTVVIMQYTE